MVCVTGIRNQSKSDKEERMDEKLTVDEPDSLRQLSRSVGRVLFDPGTNQVSANPPFA